MTTALLLSPHLDDAAFSCGGTAARLSGTGWRVVVATVFTLSVPEPRGFALACQTDKGIPAGADYMALRRAEDAAACRELGAEPLHLPHPEAPHRGYESAAELFSEARPDDAALAGVCRSLRELVDGIGPELVLAPQALGGHVDHVQLMRALDSVSEEYPGLPRLTLYYRDAPYALRRSALPSRDEIGVGVRRELPAKLRACAVYESQLGFQFGGAERMRESLAGFARAEAERLGSPEPAEAFLGSRAAAETLLRATGSVPRGV